MSDTVYGFMHTGTQQCFYWEKDIDAITDTEKAIAPQQKPFPYVIVEKHVKI